MPKIKNWSSVHLKNQWLHDEKKHMVRIRPSSGKDNPKFYDILIHKTPGKQSFHKRIGSETTMEDAKESAREWMKKHPDSIKIC